MYEIAELMTREIITISPETIISQAIKLMVENNITGIPGVRQDNIIVGMISEKDILKMDINTDKDKPVSSFMSKEVISFDINDDFIAVCETLVNKPVRRVPITSDGKLVGIISRRDAIRYMVEPF